MRPVHCLALVAAMMAQVALADTTARPGSSGSGQMVLVLPFPPPAAQDYQWAGQSVRQVLAADLTHGSRLKVLAPANSAPAADADEALKVAADAGASLVVFG